MREYSWIFISKSVFTYNLHQQFSQPRIKGKTTRQDWNTESLHRRNIEGVYIFVQYSWMRRPENSWAYTYILELKRLYSTPTRISVLFLGFSTITDIAIHPTRVFVRIFLHIFELWSNQCDATSNITSPSFICRLPCCHLQMRVENK